MANGRSELQSVIEINEVRIGTHRLQHVQASVSKGPLLLGLTTINAIGPFTINSRTSELIFDLDG